MTSLLDVRDLTVRFGGLVALNGFSIAVERGTVHSVIGPNGAGKSTLFNAICGIYPVACGQIVLDNRSLVGMRPHRIAALGVGRAFQNASMFGGLSVEAHILAGMHHRIRGRWLGRLRGGSARMLEREARAAAREVARFAGIEDILGRMATDLAYGQQKRVDVARALATDPTVLLLDEPAAGLNSAEKRQMALLLKRIATEAEVTVVLVEHDMELVMGVSDRVTALSFGEHIVTGTPSEVQQDPAVVAAYLGRPTGAIA